MAEILVPDSASIARAAAAILSGEVVAFPTETVYGLGANAFNKDAVGKIYAIKQRPAANPLIVHIENVRLISSVAVSTPAAETLADAFWPGPLTLILDREVTVARAVSAGSSTVAVRVPNHPVALALIEAAGVPLAAPSANRSEHISPTTAQHVADGLGDDIALILDGGMCAVGLESTVVDMTCHPPRILRPGAVTRTDIESVLGLAVDINDHSGSSPVRSPGQSSRHYAPNTQTHLSNDVWRNASADGRRVVVIAYSPVPSLVLPNIMVIAMPDTSRAYAARLYAALHEADTYGAQQILIEQVPETPEWHAVADRLRRASAPRPSGQQVY